MKRDKHNRPVPGQPATRRRPLLTLERTTLRRLEDNDLVAVVGASICGGGCSTKIL